MSARRARPRSSRVHSHTNPTEPAFGVQANPQKRRRLHGPSSDAPPAPSLRPVTRAMSLNLAQSCASCHRRPARMDELIECPRCAATTCTICSRTCTLGVPPSLPPTPALSYTSTPGSESSYATRTTLPSRPAEPTPAASAKRRRVDDADGGYKSTSAYHGVTVVGGDGQWSEEVRLNHADSLTDGCHRVVCKCCAIENRDEDVSYTCLDCYGLPLNVTPRIFGGHLRYQQSAFSPTPTLSRNASPSPGPSFF